MGLVIRFPAQDVPIIIQGPAPVKKPEIRIEAAAAGDAAAIVTMIYQSVHELMDFMFGSQAQAEPILKKLLARASGQFGFQYVNVMRDAGQTVGVVLC